MELVAAGRGRDRPWHLNQRSRRADPPRPTDLALPPAASTALPDWLDTAGRICFGAVGRESALVCRHRTARAGIPLALLLEAQHPALPPAVRPSAADLVLHSGAARGPAAWHP